MKKSILTFLISCVVAQVSAITFFDQLCTYNPNWKKYESRAPVGNERYFASDKEYVQAHLQSVLGILRANPTEDLSASQLSSRIQLITILEGYRVAGRFPMNYYREDRIPVFIDEHHTHCAVGYLLQQTGHEDIALRIAAIDNYIWVKDITDPAVIAWQEQSGLTLEEVKLIQGAYDSYMPFAWRLPNKYEVPQKPEVVTRYFEDARTGKVISGASENVWCNGESKNGLLDGKWTQNYSKGLPWIIGYYSQGKRSGQWMEYYQGSTQLCRTENWRNDKLNGVRKRYSREGKLIEEILFKDGKAVTKTNYSLEDSLTYVRKPLDSNLVWTEVFNHGGAMIASGHERIYNPGNLQWFQNIELTALNTMMLPNPGLVQLTTGSVNSYSGNGQYIFSPYGSSPLYNTPQLVQYEKEGDWMFFNEYSYGSSVQYLHLNGFLSRNYRHMASTLVPLLQPFANMYRMADYDSIKVEYEENNMTEFYGYGKIETFHLHIDYYDSLEAGVATIMTVYANASPRAPKRIKSCGETNNKNERIGEWKSYTVMGQAYKTENYLMAWKEEEQ